MGMYTGSAEMTYIYLLYGRIDFYVSSSYTLGGTVAGAGARAGVFEGGSVSVRVSLSLSLLFKSCSCHCVCLAL